MQCRKRTEFARVSTNEQARRTNEPIINQPDRQSKASEHASQVLALFQCHRSAIDFRDIPHDCQSKSRSGLTGGVEPRSSGEQLADAIFGDACAIVFDKNMNHVPFWFDRHKHSATAIFGGIFDEVSEQFIEILTLDADLGIMVACNIDRHAFVESRDRAFDRLEAVPDAGASLSRALRPMARARARW